MLDDKDFLTYNQQMRKLRNDKHINCQGSAHKKILIRSGYFNIVNGYKTLLLVIRTHKETIHTFLALLLIKCMQ